jgi:hypothetical protein
MAEDVLIDKFRVEPIPIKYGVVRAVMDGTVSGSGQRYEIAGFGKPRAALVFMGNTGGADGGYWTDGTTSIGFWSEDDSQACCWMASQNGVATTLVERGITTDSVARQERGSVLRTEHSCSGVANGVMLTEEIGGYPYDTLITVVLIGGPDVEAKVDTFLPATTAGNTAQETGLAFRPDCLFTMSAGITLESTTQGVQAFGVAAGHHATITNYSAHVWGQTGVGTSQNGSWLSDDYCVGQAHADSLNWGAKVNQFTGDGFIMETGAGDTGSDNIAYLALKVPGVNFHLGALTSETSTGNKTYNNVGFKPGFFFGAITPVTTIDSNFEGASVSYFAGDTTSAVNFGYHAQDNVNTTVTGNTSGTDPSLLHPSGGADMVNFSFNSVHASGYTLNYSAVNPTARKGWILSVQDINDTNKLIGNASGKIYFKA